MNAPAREVPAADDAPRSSAPPIPTVSAWVSANAGSGKTHVLVQRVLRLLLAGRAALAHSLPHLHQGGGGEHVGAGVQDARRVDRAGRRRAGDRRSSRAARRGPAAPDLDLARKLFARTIETPGGLKIQTHSRVLRTAAASLPVRGQCRRGVSRARGARGRRSAADARARAFARAPQMPDLAAAVEMIARVGGRRRLRRAAARNAEDGARKSPRSAAPRPMRARLGRAARPRARRKRRRRSGGR